MTLVWKLGLTLQSPITNDPLLDLNTQPSLDLQFATSKTLDDRVSGLPLVDHQRDASGSNSPGTYIGSDGLIKTSKVNLLTYSEDFNNGAYIKDAGVSVTVNSITSPSGSTSANLISVTDNGRVYANNTSVTGVCSVYIKAGTFSHFSVSGCFVDLTVPSTTAGSLVDVGNGWYRLTSEQRTSARHFQVQAYPDNTYSIHSTAGTYYLWGAQLEEGSTATTYIPTTNLPSAAPRFDHDPDTLESLGLLIEESRANLLSYSEDLSQWYSVDNATLSTAISTPGSTAASRLTSTTSSTWARAWAPIYNGSGTDTVGSVYLRADTPFTASLRIRYDSIQVSIQNVNVTTDWQRFTLNATGGFTSAADLMVFLNADGVSGASVSGRTLDIWGAQLEEGSFPTSYIPTAGSTVTRAADDAEITGTNFSSWYNQSEGTVFAEGSGEGPRLVGLNDGTDLNRHELIVTPTNIEVFQKNNGVNEVNMSRVKASKASFAYTLDDYGLSVGGSSVVTDTSATPPTVNKMTIGNWYNNTGQLNGRIKRLTYYPYRLGDTTLQDITS